MKKIYRIGVLGAAKITPMALIAPAKKLNNVEVYAVAARDPQRARTFAKRHNISRVHENYDDLILDHDIDIIYNHTEI